MKINITENTLLIAKTTAAFAGAASSIIISVRNLKKKDNAPAPSETLDPITQMQLDTIYRLDSVADQLAALQAMKKGDFEFDLFIRTLTQ